MFAEIALMAVLGLVRHDPGDMQPTRAPPQRHECMLTWMHPEEGWLVHSVASVKRDVACGTEIDRDAKVPWPQAWRWDGGEWRATSLSSVRCIRWTPLRVLWQRARQEARSN